jgi:hypothetical protein
VKAAYEKAKEFVKYIYDKFKAALFWVWRQVARLFSFAGELISDLVKYILNKIKDLPTMSKRLINFLYDNAYKIAKLMASLFKFKYEMCDLVISILQPINKYACIAGVEISIVTDVINFF